MLKFLILFLNAQLAFGNLRELKKVRTCPATCPPCTQCDSKKGTCSILSNFVTCNSNTLSGVCILGKCNTQVSLPLEPLQKCQTYQCPVSGTCSIVDAIDGSDCSFPGAGLHSFCVATGCKPILDGLTTTLPFYNVGCMGLPDGILCDTNHDLLDNESCQNGICKFPDGTYTGLLPQ